jgi:hypothetical protein
LFANYGIFTKKVKYKMSFSPMVSQLHLSLWAVIAHDDNPKTSNMLAFAALRLIATEK